MKRSEGERVRARHAIDRLRTILGSIEESVMNNAFIGPDVPQVLATASSELSGILHRMLAYELVERSGTELQKDKIDG